MGADVPSVADDRLTLIERVIADKPPVHDFEEAHFAPGGVWDTDRDCYRFLAEHCGEGDNTLETGLGISTVLFAAWGTHHTCVVPNQGEVDRCRAYCEARGIGIRSVDFQVGFSDEVLPALPPRELALLFIDGGHGFPAPIIDWYYA